MAINTNYNNYSTLFSNVGSTTGSQNNYNDIYKLINSGYSASKASYGKNTAQALPASTQNFLTESKSASESLKSTLNSLLGKTKSGTSSFDEKTAVSSNTDSLAIKSVDAQKSTLKDSEVSIEQVATTQKNVGDKVSASEKGFSSGTQYLELEVGGKKSTISYYVSASDTNKAVQQKMADAINSKKLGVTASVSSEATGSVNEKTSLTLESNATGVTTAGKDNFSVKDLSGSSAVGKFGIGAVDQKAQNAKYKINDGAVQESKSNDVSLGNGVTATLKKATTTDSVKITMGKDTVSSQNKVREMVNGFNGLLESAEGNKDDKRTGRLISELGGQAKAYSASLARIGISTNKSGYLQIDEKKMKSAAENGDLEKFFKSNGKDSNYGFANRVASTAEKVNRNPAEYVSKTSTSYNSSFNQYKYNSIVNTGLMFNAMF